MTQNPKITEKRVFRKLEDLNLIDNFLFQAVLSDKTEGEEFARILLSTILGKQIRNVRWEQVEEIKPMTVLRNPAYVLLIRGEKNLNLDRRKKIKQAIEHYSDKCIN